MHSISKKQIPRTKYLYTLSMHVVNMYIDYYYDYGGRPDAFADENH